MKITQNTTLSIGMLVALFLILIGFITTITPLFSKIAYQKDLKASEDKTNLNYKSLYERLDRFGVRMEKRFDKIEQKLNEL